MSSARSNQLKSLMQEHSKKVEQRIDSPYAKYSGAGLLSCSLCSQSIKNALAWTGHVNSKTHRDRLLAQQQKSQAAPSMTTSANKSISVPVAPTAQQVAVKRAAEPTQRDLELLAKFKKRLESEAAKSAPPQSSKTSAPSQQPNKPSAPPQPSSKTSASAQQSNKKETLHPSPSTKNKSSKTEKTARVALDSGQQSTVESIQTSIPADSGAAPISSDNAPLTTNIPDSIPEGFFDDARKDAKVRHVEYKDKLETEWELFQKTLQTQMRTAEQIEEEEEEVMTDIRNLEEIETELSQWEKVNMLEKKKDVVLGGKQAPADGEKQAAEAAVESNSATSDSDEEDTDGATESFLNAGSSWRSKAALPF